MTIGREILFDRRVSPDLIHAAREGWLRPLLSRRTSDPSVFDVQTRRDQRGTRSWLTLYAGLSGILNVEERGGLCRLRTAAKYRTVAPFDPAWGTWQSPDVLESQWPEINGFIDGVMSSTVIRRYLDREGAVHAAMCRDNSSDYATIQREASPSFVHVAGRDVVTRPLVSGIHAAMTSAARSDGWWPGVRDGGRMPSMGTSVDILAVSPDDRLLVIEAKPAGASKGIAWAPAQVRLYAELFYHLAVAYPSWWQVLDEMLDQRRELGLTASHKRIRGAMPIVPVVAIGAGATSGEVRGRLDVVQAVLDEHDPAPHLEPAETWMLAADGTIASRTVHEDKR